MSDYMKYDFNTDIAVMTGKRSDYYFVSVPRDISKHIRHFTQHIQRGFKSLKVKAHIGKSAWDSSIFPSSRDETFILLLNKKIRDAEKLRKGDTATVCLHVRMA